MNAIISAVVAFVISIFPIGYSAANPDDVIVNEDILPTVKPVPPTPTPSISDVPKSINEQNDEKKTEAYNTASGKEMPATVSEKAIEKSPVLVSLPTPTPTPSPVPIPTDPPGEPVIEDPPNIYPPFKKGKIDPIIIIPPPRD